MNFPNSAVCRKCGYKFEAEKTVHRISPNKNRSHVINPQSLTQADAETLLGKAILSEDKKIISLSGIRGVGKSYVLSRVIKNLQGEQFVWLYGKCSPITQFTSGGLIQDILFNLYDLPNFCINSPKFKKDASKLFRNKFPYLNNEEIDDFLNFLYPVNFGMFEEISARKTKTFNLLNKIFDNIVLYSKFIIVADNFDDVDGLSYEFLHSYIKKESVYKDLKLLLIYSGVKPSKGYFNFHGKENQDVYFDMRISPLDRKGMMELLQTKEEKYPNFPKISDAERELMFAQS